MKNQIPTQTRLVSAQALKSALAAACLALLMVIGTSPALARNENPRILSPNSAPYGQTYGEWTAAWWQWALGIPEAENPVADTTGEFCHVGQSGPVWFLAGTFGDSVERTCTVPAGKGIFVPVFNWIFGAAVFDCEPSNPGVPCDVDALRASAAAATESATVLEVSIDGVPVNNVTAYRASSPEPFSVTFPEGAVFGLPAGTFSPHVADGYWLMLAPLRAGQHTLDIHVESSLGFGFEVVYHLTVE